MGAALRTSISAVALVACANESPPERPRPRLDPATLALLASPSSESRDAGEEPVHAGDARRAPRLDAVKRGQLSRKGGKPAVALTFDCAWVPEDKGLAVLDALRDRGVKATFFVAGPFVLAPGSTSPNEASLRMIRRIVDDGHEVGNHTRNHPHNRDRVAWDQEVKDLARGWDLVVNRLYGASAPPNARMKPYWRAPFGEYDERSLSMAADSGFPVHFGWNVDVRDAIGLPSCASEPHSPSCTGPDRQTRQVLRFVEAHPGLDATVVLAHLGAPYGWGSDPKGLRALVDSLRASGRELALLSEILPGSQSGTSHFSGP